IRAFHVTGVQTCALPIFFNGAHRVDGVSRVEAIDRIRRDLGIGRKAQTLRVGIEIFFNDKTDFAASQLKSHATIEIKEICPQDRSEESRVGKESRQRWRE